MTLDELGKAISKQEIKEIWVQPFPTIPMEALKQLNAGLQNCPVCNGRDEHKPDCILKEETKPK